MSTGRIYGLYLYGAACPAAKTPDAVRTMLTNALAPMLPPPPSPERPLKRQRRSPNGERSEYEHSTGPLGWSGEYEMRHEASTSAHDAPKTQQKDDRRKLSCKECRRLKLKCDRVFPCQSCCKRGCAEICPEGSLTSGRGSRFILANTEQLHTKIQELSDRVRNLEQALQGYNPDDPLLASELLLIKTAQEFHAAGNAPGSPTGATASSSQTQQTKEESLHTSVSNLSIASPVTPCVPTCKDDTTPIVDQNGIPQVPPGVLQLSMSFPFPWRVDMSVRQRIRNALPRREEAEAICEEARRNALWQYSLDSSETFLPNLLQYCYTMPINELSPRRLALLLMVLSIGSLVDLKRPLGYLSAEAYHHLARASVCEIPLMEEPDFDTVHALFFMIWYHLIFSDNRKALGYAWNLLGFVAKLVQGVHRETSGSSKLIPEESERRRNIFWELLNLDYRMSLTLGRPPSISLQHVTIKAPSYTAPNTFLPADEMVYHEWKNTFLQNCLCPILEYMIGKDQPGYSRVLELDHRVRESHVPPLLEHCTPASPRYIKMQRALVSSARAIALLQLHRRSFSDAMSINAARFTLRHENAPSVVATYLAANSLIDTIEDLFKWEPEISVRFLFFWFNAFSAAMTLQAFIHRVPSSSIVPHALRDLERITLLFRRASKILPFSGRTLPILDNVLQRCHKTRQAAVVPASGAPQQFCDMRLPLFAEAHPALAQFAETLQTATFYHPMEMLPAEYQTYHQHSHQPVVGHHRGTRDEDAWMPDPYNFNSNGISVEERYTGVARAFPTPFVPSSSRVLDDETFNLEHGALNPNLVLDSSIFMAYL
uniref:Zn(2)-C6 fungal-type domain-containing protein n=1 Tax=Schizophyllum commune (strain H4-8 / FGSC 9210) TaxID=578458 RepID=D8PXF1_SCHCM